MAAGEERPCFEKARRAPLDMAALLLAGHAAGWLWWKGRCRDVFRSGGVTETLVHTPLGLEFLPAGSWVVAEIVGTSHPKRPSALGSRGEGHSFGGRLYVGKCVKAVYNI